MNYDDDGSKSAQKICESSLYAIIMLVEERIQLNGARITMA